MHSLFVFLLLLCCWPKEKPTLLLNVVAHADQHTVIPNAAVAFRGDSLTLVADARRIRLDLPQFDVLGLYGRHVYPAVIDSVQHNHPYQVLLDSGVALVPQWSQSGASLQTGESATLIVTDTLIALDTAPRVLHIFVQGQPVVVTDSVLSATSKH